MLETKKGAYRGNHTHPYNQYTMLLSGDATYVLYVDGEYVEKPMKQHEVVKVEAGVPHIMIVNEDITTFEWWDGEFIAELCTQFPHLTEGRVGPEDFMEEEP